MTSRTAVAVVGGGPVGLSLALGLARHGVRSVLVERKPRTNTQSRAPAVHLRSLEIFRQWGVDEQLRNAGTLKRSLPMHAGPVERRPTMSFAFGQLDDEADQPGVLFLEQGQIERILLAEVRASGWCDVRFSTQAVALHQRRDGVRLILQDGDGERVLDAEFVVGCDGTGSFVRDALGLSFDGVTFPLRPMLADVRVTDERDGLPWPRFHNGRRGLTGAQRLAPRHWRIIRIEAGTPMPDEPVVADEVRRHAATVIGDGPMEVIWASRFQFQRRTSPRFHAGRVLLAGDAAHAFPPANGQGMNAGVQDAHNLAWKLAHALRGGDVDPLLESYDVERRTVVGTVSRHVSLLTRVGIQAPRSMRAAVLGLMRLALAVPPAHRERVRNMAMIDLEIPASPLLDPQPRAAGIRLPNVQVRSPAGGDTRLYDLLSIGPAVLDLSTDPGVAAGLPVDRIVRIGDGGYEDPGGSLPALLDGGPGWILVRPDLHVAWARSHPADLAGATRRALGMTAQ